MNEDDTKTPPTPIAPLDQQPKEDTPDVMEYYAYSGADRLKYVKEQIEEREKAHFNLYLIQQSLDGNPEPGKHHEIDTSPTALPNMKVPCVCRNCELPRVKSLLKSMTYAINKLKAVHASLA